MRWVCPKCEGAKNAPSRPRRDDVRRYCLPCSEATGRLVERESPVLARRRLEAAGRRKERGQRERAREQAAAQSYPACLEAEWDRMVRLPTAREALPVRRPAIDIRRRTGSSSSGRAWTWRVMVRAGSDPNDARAVMLHELAHLVAFSKESWSHPWGHDSRFASAFAALACEYLGVQAIPHIPRSPHRKMTTAIGVEIGKLETARLDEALREHEESKGNDEQREEFVIDATDDWRQDLRAEG